MGAQSRLLLLEKGQVTRRLRNSHEDHIEGWSADHGKGRAQRDFDENRIGILLELEHTRNDEELTAVFFLEMYEINRATNRSTKSEYSLNTQVSRNGFPCRTRTISEFSKLASRSPDLLSSRTCRPAHASRYI